MREPMTERVRVDYVAVAVAVVALAAVAVVADEECAGDGTPGGLPVVAAAGTLSAGLVDDAVDVGYGCSREGLDGMCFYGTGCPWSGRSRVNVVVVHWASFVVRRPAQRPC